MLNRRAARGRKRKFWRAGIPWPPPARPNRTIANRAIKRAIKRRIVGMEGASPARRTGRRRLSAHGPRSSGTVQSRSPARRDTESMSSGPVTPPHPPPLEYQYNLPCVHSHHCPHGSKIRALQEIDRAHTADRRLRTPPKRRLLLLCEYSLNGEESLRKPVCCGVRGIPRM